jgi:hypothetical protein
MRPKHRRLEAATTPTAPGDVAAPPQGHLAGAAIIFPARRAAAHCRTATIITAYLGNEGVPEHAQSMAAHESPRTNPASSG